MIAMHFWSTGRDATVFENPDRFDPDRPNLHEHLGFGRGVRFCMGAPLAGSRTPCASKCATRPLRATSVTTPGT